MSMPGVPVQRPLVFRLLTIKIDQANDFVAVEVHHVASIGYPPHPKLLYGVKDEVFRVRLKLSADEPRIWYQLASPKLDRCEAFR